MIREHLSQRFPGSEGPVLLYREHLARLLENFVSSGFADPKFEAELAAGDDQKFWSCLSEALVFPALAGHQFLKRQKLGHGPDFLVALGSRRVWIEVVCPAPSNVPAQWINTVPGQAIDFPHVDILLRWTSAIKAKAERLVGDRCGQVGGYLRDPIVGSDDCYVIAVNGCRLRNGPFPALYGISQFPFAAEALFPIGPYQIQIDRETLQKVAEGHQHRPYLQTRSGAKVPAYTFLDPAYRPISAVYALDLNGSSAIGGSEPKVVIHNPYATNPLPAGFLPADCEYRCKPDRGGWLLERHASTSHG